MSLLEVRSVSVTFGGVAALKRVSFALGENEIVGLIGPNGAGKTTLFNCLSGFQVPDEGGMVFGGVRLESAHRIRSRPSASPEPFRRAASSSA